MKTPLEGIWAPTPTPIDPQGVFDPKAMRFLVDFLIKGGIDGLFPLGTSGEFALFEREERRRVVETVANQAGGRVPVFAGVSDPSLENVRALAKDALDVGADGIIATPPYYFTTGGDALFGYFETMATICDLPLMVYNIPEWTHSYVPPETIQRLAERRLIVGMKYTEYNLLNLLRFLKLAGKQISVFTGSDAMAFTSLEFGGRGAIIGAANVAPRIASSIFDEFRKGNFEMAREAQLKLLPVIEAVGTGRFPAGLKEAMKLIAVPVGGVKRPMEHLSAEERKRVAALLAEAGMLKKTA